ncbi:hypothetical protein [Streptomyces sp. NPDC055109]
MPSARTAYTLALPGLTATDDIDTVINWGLGADRPARLRSGLCRAVPGNAVRS